MEEKIVEIIKNFKKWLFETEDPENPETVNEPEDGYQRDFQTEENIQNLDAIIVVVKPKSFNDTVKICKQIKKGRAVMLSLEDMVPKDKQRLVDFISGVVMARDGLIAKVYNNVYVCAAKNIGIIDEPFEE